MMEPNRKPLTSIYTEWLDAWRLMFGHTPPKDPAKDSAPPTAQTAAVQDWEDEGGSIKQTKKPGQEPGPKIPF